MWGGGGGAVSCEVFKNGNVVSCFFLVKNIITLLSAESTQMTQLSILLFLGLKAYNIILKCFSGRVFMLLTSDHKASSLDPYGGRSQLIAICRFITKILSLILYHRLDRA